MHRKLTFYHEADDLTLKHVNDGFDSYKHPSLFVRWLLMEWSGVDYCNVFISCLDFNSDGTHSLYWSVNDVMLNFSKSVPMKNSSSS